MQLQKPVAWMEESLTGISARRGPLFGAGLCESWRRPWTRCCRMTATVATPWNKTCKIDGGGVEDADARDTVYCSYRPGQITTQQTSLEQRTYHRRRQPHAVWKHMDNATTRCGQKTGCLAFSGAFHQKLLLLFVINNNNPHSCLSTTTVMHSLIGAA